MKLLAWGRTLSQHGQPAWRQLVRIELLRAAHRPFGRLWLGWFLIAGATGPILAAQVATPTAGFMIRVGGYFAASLGVIPAAGLGLVAGVDDVRHRVARDIHLSGIRSSTEIAARMFVAALSVVILWLVGVVAAVLVTTGFLLTGQAILAASASIDLVGNRFTGTGAYAVGVVSLPLLAASCTIVAIALRSALRAAMLMLATAALWFASVSFINTAPGLLWIARFMPFGAAYQISTLTTSPHGDERFRVSLWIALVSGVVWFVIVPLAALRRALGSPASQAAEPHRRPCSDADTIATRPHRSSIRVPPRRIILVATIAALVLGLLSTAFSTAGPASFDSVYQWFTQMRDRDVMLRIAEDVRRGRWDDAQKGAGQDIRRLAPEFVAYIRRHPEADFWVVWTGAGFGEQARPGLEVVTLKTVEDGSVGWSGPTFVFHMRFLQGRWVVDRVSRDD